MSALMFVRDGRTLPFVPVTVASQEAIRRHVPKRRPYAVATYIALLEFANEDRSDRAAVTQRNIVERVGAGRTTVQAALVDLQAAGVLRVIERHHGASRIENEYIVVEPSNGRDESDTPARHTSDPRPPHEQLTQELVEERGERERPRANVDAIFEAWVSATGRDPHRTKLTPERQRCISRAVASHGLTDCLAAVQHIGADDWARGQNDRQTRFDDIQHALGTAERIERWSSQAPRTASVTPIRRDRNGYDSKADMIAALNAQIGDR
jgi:hypothetical protein